MRRGTRRQRKQKKQRKQKRQSRRNKLRGGDLGIPTILTLEGTPLSSNAVVVSPTGTQSLDSYLRNQRLRGSTGYDDGD